jgi:DNA-binding cell septation regulator SpoVG
MTAQERPQGAQVAILNLHLGGPTPAVLAVFTVRLGRAVLVHGCRLVQSRAGGVFLSWPQRKDPGTGAWTDIIEVPDAVTALVRDAAQAAYEAAIPHRQAAPDRDDDLDGLPF